MLLSVLFVLAVGITGALSSDVMNDLAAKEKYCAVDANHTACKYRTLNETKACGKVLRRGLNGAEKLLLVSLINEKRRSIARGSRPPQPSASNMNLLVWDPEAASIAQLWADQCTLGPDQARHTVSGPAPVPNGQNRFIKVEQGRGGKGGRSNSREADFDESNSDSDSVEAGLDDNQDSAALGDRRRGGGRFRLWEAVDAWFKELANFAAAGVNSYTANAKTDNYTQLVWAETAAVGCGYIFQSEKHHLVCNFVATGNVAGQPVYKTGTPCSACPAALPKCIGGGLCAHSIP